jgi:hypothetical protein
MDKPTTEEQFEYAKGGFEEISDRDKFGKDKILIQGVTKDYAEFEMHRIALDANRLIDRVHRVIETLEARRADNLSVVGRLLKEKKPWVGLSIEERNDCLVEADPCECLAGPEAEELMRCIEAKLKEKNA